MNLYRVTTRYTPMGGQVKHEIKADRFTWHESGELVLEKKTGSSTLNQPVFTAIALFAEDTWEHIVLVAENV